jgi:hypothetical protein
VGYILDVWGEVVTAEDEFYRPAEVSEPLTFMESMLYSLIVLIVGLLLFVGFNYLFTKATTEAV